MEQLQPLGELREIVQHVQVRGCQSQMGYGEACPVQGLRQRRPHPDSEDVPVRFHHILAVRLSEKREPTKRDTPGGGPGVDPLGFLPGVDAIDPRLVLVPLRNRNQQIGQRAVHTIHEGIRCQPGANHQLAGAVKQPSGVVGVLILGRRAGGGICGTVRRSVPPARDARHSHQISPAGGEGVPARPGDAAQRGLELSVFDGGPGPDLAAVRHELALLLRRKRLKGLVDAQGRRERQSCLAPIQVSSHLQPAPFVH
ncbi:hypothetical protein StoSoilB13_44140 (plasmid) [Arthrobacter sp. StoSoilB13]|nr:hypothetical protein StoSoilB13_44140 [Arthrobacter sp. StoSoilB13]